MARLLKHILLFAASLISLIVLTVNYFNIQDSYYERQSYVQDYDVYDAYKISIKENSNLSYKLCDENDLAEYSNHIANMPCAVFKGNYYRKKADYYDLPDAYACSGGIHKLHNSPRYQK